MELYHAPLTCESRPCHEGAQTTGRSLTLLNAHRAPTLREGGHPMTKSGFCPTALPWLLRPTKGSSLRKVRGDQEADVAARDYHGDCDQQVLADLQCSAPIGHSGTRGAPIAE